MEQRLIDANALKARIQAWEDRLKGYYGTNDDIVITLDKVQKQIIDDMPTVDAVPVVFINDPFHVVYQAFKELYPDKECEILFDYNVETTDTHERVKGVTIFPDDGSIPQIRIDCEQTIDQISGILAHELAHVALGKPEWDDRELDHGEDFEKVLDAIFDRFNELQGFCTDGERKDGEHD